MLSLRNYKELDPPKVLPAPAGDMLATSSEHQESTAGGKGPEEEQNLLGEGLQCLSYS
jgi:hypothetical protein